MVRFFRPIMCPICRGACVVRPSMFLIVLQIWRKTLLHLCHKALDWHLTIHASFLVDIEMHSYWKTQILECKCLEIIQLWNVHVCSGFRLIQFRNLHISKCACFALWDFGIWRFLILKDNWKSNLFWNTARTVLCDPMSMKTLRGKAHLESEKYSISNVLSVVQIDFVRTLNFKIKI